MLPKLRNFRHRNTNIDDTLRSRLISICYHIRYWWVLIDNCPQRPLRHRIDPLANILLRLYSNWRPPSITAFGEWRACTISRVSSHRCTHLVSVKISHVRIDNEGGKFLSLRRILLPESSNRWSWYETFDLAEYTLQILGIAAWSLTDLFEPG